LTDDQFSATLLVGVALEYMPHSARVFQKLGISRRDATAFHDTSGGPLFPLSILYERSQPLPAIGIEH
jgi:hypothetical protein